MSNQHAANSVPEITREEHSRIGGVDLKHVAVFDNAGNQITSFGGAPNTGNVTINPGPNFIGLATVVQGTAPWQSLATLYPSASWIGLATIQPASAWPNPNTYIGLATIDIGTQNKITLQGNVTISDSKGFVGLVSIAQPISTTFSGNVTLDAGSRTQISGNVTLSDSKGFIGLVTVGGGAAWADPKTYIGLATVSNATAWPNPNTYIGLATIDIGTQNKVALAGNVTISDSKGYIGLVTVGNMPNVAIVGNVTLSDSKAFVGLVTIGGISTVTLADPKGFIGLTTIVPTFISGYTSFSTVISATGPATIVVPPSGQKIFVRNIYTSSLGRSEVSSWRVNSTATANVIPWTSLPTQGSIAKFLGENGEQWGLANDGLTFALNGAATIGVRVNVRFAT